LGVTGRPLLHKSLYLPELEIITLLVNPGVGDGRFKRKTAAFLRCLPWSIRPAAIVPRCHHARCTCQECPRIAPLTSLKAQKSLEIQDLWRADDRLRPKRLARSKQWKRLASAADCLGGEAKPPAVGWSSYDGRTSKCRGTARAGGCRGRCDRRRLRELRCLLRCFGRMALA